MKRGSKIILFIAITAITFGCLHYFIDRRHWGNDFRNQHGCGREMQMNDPVPAAVKKI